MPREDFKRFCVKLLWFAPVFLALAAVNYAVDPAHLFGKRESYETRIAELLLAKTNVANPANCDERLLQKACVRGLTQAPQVLVLGSSRALQISGDNFAGQDFFNSSVSGAVLEDLIGIYELYAQRHLKPALVVIGIDPWMFNANHGQTRWKSLEREYRAGLVKMGSAAGTSTAPPMPWSGGTFEKLLELFSVPYFQDSLRTWTKRMREREQPVDYYPTGRVMGEEAIKRSDGALVYAATPRNRSPEEVKRLALEYLRPKGVYSLKQFRRLDERSAALLEAFVDRLQREGVRVCFFLAPYHPLVYARLVQDEKYKIITEVERHLAALAEKRGIPLAGSYNPAGLGCEAAEFYDGMHPRESCIGKILSMKLSEH